MERQYYLDNLKVLLIILVIFHHASQPYSPFSSWPYTLSNPDDMMPWIWHFHSTNAAFSMGLFFFISGLFVPRSFDRQGAGMFIRNKLVHLGIPLLIGGTILSLLTKQLEIAHLWFVELLLVFCLLYALARCFIPPIASSCDSRPTILGISVVGVLMGVGSYFIRQISPQDHWIWFLGFIHIEPAHLLQYLMMFVLGILASRFHWLDKMRNADGASAFCLGMLLVAGNYLRSDGTFSHFIETYFGIYESLLCVFLCFGLLWLFRIAGNWSNTFWRWCGAQSYGAYIVHLFLLLGIQFATDSVVLPPMLKFICIGVVTTVFSFLFPFRFTNVLHFFSHNYK